MCVDTKRVYQGKAILKRKNRGWGLVPFHTRFGLGVVLGGFPDNNSSKDNHTDSYPDSDRGEDINQSLHESVHF